MERPARSTAAVVVTYNRKDLLHQCIDALLAQTAPCEILIVDNHSTDGTGSMISSMPQLHYRNTGSNLGGAGGFHYGMRWAVEAGFDYVWVMDDDCLPQPDALEKLLQADALLGGEYGFLSSAVLWTDGHECIMNRQKIAKTFYRHIELMQHGIIQIQQATFVSLLFPAQTIRRFGLPISQYFIWGDDIEYTRRIALRGNVESFLAGQSVVTHAMASNSGSDIATDDISRIGRYQLAYRNEFFTYRQQGFGGILFYFVRCAKGLFRITVYARSHRLRRYGALLSGFFSGLLFNPKIEYIQEA